MKAYDIPAKRKPITQAELAKRLGWSVAELVGVESGRVDISYEQYQEILFVVTEMLKEKETRLCEKSRPLVSTSSVS